MLRILTEKSKNQEHNLDQLNSTIRGLENKIKTFKEMFESLNN